MSSPGPPYDTLREDLAKRKDQYRRTVVAICDAEAPATRRQALERPDNGPNPLPLKASSAKSKAKVAGFLRTAVAPDHTPSMYDYLSWEDINVALCRLVEDQPLPHVLPTVSRDNWVRIPSDKLRLPTLDEPASLPALLGIVQLLGFDLRGRIVDIFLAAFSRAKEDDDEAKEADRRTYCYPALADLYERWLDRDRTAEQLAAMEKLLEGFSMPGTEAVPIRESAPPAEPAIVGYELPRFTPEQLRYFAQGFLVLHQDGQYARVLIERSRELCPGRVLSDEVHAAWDWLGFLASLAPVPTGEALRRIAKRLIDDGGFDSATRDEYWDDGKIDEGFLADIPRNPFLWTVRFKRPKLRLPPDFVFPPWNAEGVYWWRVLHSHVILHILTLKDTADFHSTDLLRFAYRLHIFDPLQRPSAVPEYVCRMVRSSLLNFKYWLDESPSGNVMKGDESDPEMTFWSENHQLLFSQSAYLAGHLFPDDRFRSSDDRPLRGRDQKERGRRRVEWWLDNRLRYGFSEWNSPGYYNEDAVPLLNLVDYAPDENIRTKAAMVMDLLLFDLARYTCAGSFGVTAGRAYGEHKFTGWDQSIGDLIQIAFGTRGAYVATAQNCSVAMATSEYEVPEAIIAIGLDRHHADRAGDAAAFIDRSRVSVYPGEAGTPDPRTLDGTVFWWGNGNYVTQGMRENTERQVEAHPHLANTDPFKVLYPDDSILGKVRSVLFAIAKIPGLSHLLEGYLGAGMQRAGFSGALLPFPLNIMTWGVGATGTVLMLKSVGKICRALLDLAKRFVDWALAWTGLTSTDDEPDLPTSELLEFFYGLLDSFNRGSVLQRANQYTYSNGHAMLSSVQNHLPGAIAFQKQPWMACLGCDVQVWTTCPWPEQSLLESIFRIDTIGNLEEATGLLFKYMFQPFRAIFGLARPGLPNIFGHDGPNDWTGSFALPMVVQEQNVAVIAYNMPLEQRASVDNITHAWFPSYMFDEARGPEAADDSDARWIYGRKGQGFVALYSAQGMEWESDEEESLKAKGGRNVWICIVDRAASPETASKDFSAFCARIPRCAPDIHHLNGLNALGDLRGRVRVPRPRQPPASWPWLAFNYDDGRATLNGQPVALDNHPRWENRYVSLNGDPPAAGTTGTVPWGATRYYIHHSATRSWLFHDHTAARRRRSEDEFQFRIPVDLDRTAARLLRMTPEQRLVKRRIHS